MMVLFTLCATALTVGCTSAENGDDGNKGSGGDNGSNPPAVLGGYADPDGVLILNQGATRLENGSVTWIAPDGTVEEDIYGKVNGSAVGNTSQDLWLNGGKIYILSDNDELPDLGSGVGGDGSLVIVDAVTFRREKVFRYEELTFPRPEGSTEPEEIMNLMTPFENIVVLDEHNVFLSDPKAVFRLDAATGKMNLVEGSYHFGNSGGTIESVVAMRGLVIIGDRFYCGGGGFWSDTKLFEFVKGSDQIGRTLDLSGEFISGLCRTGDHEIMIATCGRSGQTKSYLTFVDTDSWTVTLEKQIKADISAEFMNTSGITLSGDYLYFAAGSLTVSRISLKTWKVEEYIQVANDVPNARYLTCNVIADPQKNLLYVSVADDRGEKVVPNGNILIYDCSGDEPRLVKNLENKGNYPVNIYPMSRFY